jgi:hypothetical protein
MTRTTAGPILFVALVVICIGASMVLPQLQVTGRAMNARVRRRWIAYRQWTTLRQRVVMGVAVFAVFIFLVLIQWWLAQWFFTYQEATKSATKEHFWIAVLLGKWPPASVPYSSRNFWSALAIGISVLLNVGFYVTLLDLWRRVKKEAAMRMQLTTGLHIRDEIAKAEIYQSKAFNSLSEGDQEIFEDLIEKAFDRADALWRKQFVPPNTDIDKLTLG